ncbi:hypothetical protein [Tsukamurella tyrosinosolvens]|uniref:hypothetical protein n=1 Tax=Tsukamurella tyrosinosolvens TaxID=57704 RepID=UPI002DD4393F|nr:hypothetical protein [Tsukamurella tyrosinosolvens]MEC4616296.1 hypothetical protein [Tsukamurella tyrosinosolvens]
MSLRTRLIAYGRWDTYVPAQPVRDHIAYLHGMGLSSALIARLAGVDPAAVYFLVERSTARCDRQNAAKILEVEALRPHDHRIPDDALVPCLGSARKVQALCAMGWEARTLARDSGVPPSTIRHWIDHPDGRMTAINARRIHDLFRARWNVDGGSARARGAARRNWWALPLEWDDIDDPDEVPSGRRELFGQQRGKTLDRREQVEAWMDDPRPDWAKDSVAELAERLGFEPRTIERDKALIRRQRAERERAA